ncbi:hypothetical protein F4808DRAFT_438737 [Astrocystis sublimbata]|nr:hypothetical protein F4808DRAFT_438737 [Astrocystis sublimbata]
MQLQGAFAILSVLAVTSAAPLQKRCGEIPKPLNPPAPGPIVPSNNSLVYNLPSTGGATSLPSPDTPLKHIVVGHGIQNYTCPAAGEAGVSAGALAVLHDITDLYPSASLRALSGDAWSGLTSKVLRTTQLPINIETAATAPWPAPADLTVEGIATPLAYMGHHYFDINGTPTFSLHDDAELLKAKKLSNISAPASADQGLTDEGAVDWLLLADKGGSVGLKSVYRVLTSGGNPAICGSEGETQSVPYTAMYWLY